MANGDSTERAIPRSEGKGEHPTAEGEIGKEVAVAPAIPRSEGKEEHPSAQIAIGNEGAAVVADAVADAVLGSLNAVDREIKHEETVGGQLGLVPRCADCKISLTNYVLPPMQEHHWDKLLEWHPAHVADGKLMEGSSSTSSTSVNNFGDRHLPRGLLPLICRFLSPDEIARLQTVSKGWRKELERIVAAERIRMMDPVQLAAHMVGVYRRRACAQTIANLMRDYETYLDAFARLMNSRESIVPFWEAGTVLESLRNNPYIKRERRSYFIQLSSRFL